jgi:hypothetical protein
MQKPLEQSSLQNPDVQSLFAEHGELSFAFPHLPQIHTPDKQASLSDFVGSHDWIGGRFAHCLSHISPSLRFSMQRPIQPMDVFHVGWFRQYPPSFRPFPEQSLFKLHRSSLFTGGGQWGSMSSVSLTFGNVIEIHVVRVSIWLSTTASLIL